MPTLFLTECVLMYMPHDASDMLLSFLSQKFSDAHFINYDVVWLLSFTRMYAKYSLLPMKDSLNEVKLDEVDLWRLAIKAASQLKTILCFSFIAESYRILNF